MKAVLKIKAKRTNVGPGVCSYDAEAKVNDGDIVYVHVNWGDGPKHYTVCAESIWKFMTKGGTGSLPEFSEEYSTLTGASESAYRAVFELLDGVLSAIANGVE